MINLLKFLRGTCVSQYASSKPLKLFSAVTLVSVLVAANPSSASTNHTVSNRIKTLVDFRDENLVRQQQDFSCGAAALATLLRYALGDPVTEQQIVADLFAGLAGAEAAKREKEGFSLYDLQQVAQNRGYRAEGFNLKPEFLADLNGPVIVFIETMGYKHFAVLKGVKGDRVYLADPSRGNIRMPAYRFLDAWMRNGTGIIFVVEPARDNQGAVTTLKPDAGRLIQPEIIAVRQLLAVRAPFVSR